MFSSLRNRPRTLQAKLIASILGLMALVLVVIGVVTTIAMRAQLTDQLDRQLLDARERTEHYSHPNPDLPGDPVDAPGQGAGTLGAVILGGQVSNAATMGLFGDRVDIPSEQAAQLAAVPLDGEPHTVDFANLGAYRVIASAGPPGVVVITGLSLKNVNDSIRDLLLVELAVAASGVILAGLAGVTIVRLSLRPLQRVAQTASRVAELPLARGEVDLTVRVPDADTDPATEVGRVGLALNRMLGHVADALAARHASETRVRQFVADASHELRTPLAAIRGYAELTRRGRDEVPPDVSRALHRIESEGARMTALVDDLLLLARLDSGRPLAQEEVDLSRLMVDTLGDAHAAGPDHTWRLDLPDDAVVVVGDGARLHQVLANLLANARTHTPAGTVVTASLGLDGDRAVIAVLDNGPGIPAELQPEVFERFARGDSSRSRAAGGTGLGLAIVAAVVEAHRGQVLVSSRPGRTEFVVRLPGARRVVDEWNPTGGAQPVPGVT
jgi:two-component system, OmpR family, sensor kinase